jgi:diguanylate cyclase (GGDEF)-like protein
LSFGRRLILFFLLIVVLPMLAVAGLLWQVTAESRTGKADARLAASVETALRLADEDAMRAERLAVRQARDPGLAAALRSGSPQALRTAASRLAGEAEVVELEILGPNGEQLARAGQGQGAAFGEIELEGEGAMLGTLRVALTRADAYVERVALLTGRDAVLFADGRAIAGTAELPEDEAPPTGETEEVELDGSEQRARSVELGSDETLVVVGPLESSELVTINLRVVILLLTLLAIAITLTFYLARTMHELHERVSGQAITDELTGLSNQRRFRDLLAKETERAKRFKHDLSLLMLDLDDFKKVNDTHGHLQGDDVLKAVAVAVREESRGVDEPARYGGEELAVALPETSADGAHELAERIRTRIEDVRVPLRDGRGTTGVTVSIGVAQLGGSVDSPDQLIEAADKALYAAKRGGKNRSRKARGGTRRKDRRRTKASAKG